MYLTTGRVCQRVRPATRTTPCNRRPHRQFTNTILSTCRPSQQRTTAKSVIPLPTACAARPHAASGTQEPRAALALDSPPPAHLLRAVFAANLIRNLRNEHFLRTYASPKRVRTQGSNAEPAQPAARQQGSTTNFHAASGGDHHMYANRQGPRQQLPTAVSSEPRLIRMPRRGPTRLESVSAFPT
jgi:hypothetical protein